ncbi:MAG: hypothetical protein JNJ90_02375 [Saprospiraceae bacterium]|jgi:AraC family chitin signaling transcriptional activator|nr:hypothetical protein [Saprospiraceae bacterium]
MSVLLQKFSWCAVLLLCGIQVISAQVLPEKGVPLIRNFTPAQYHHKGKIWDIDAAPNGIVYMASDKGLVEFDGTTWNSFKGSKGVTRSLLVAGDSLLYTGSDLDFGVWKKNGLQHFEYTSLYPFQDVVQEVSEEFWEIHRIKDDIVFVSSQNIYVYKSRQIIKTPAPHRFSGSFSVRGALYLADEKLGLYTFDGFALRKVSDYPDKVARRIAGIYQDSGGLVVVTRDSGLYRYASGQWSRLNNDLSEALRMAKVFRFEPFGDDYLAFGTVMKGLYIADKRGKIIHHINKYKGLPSNTVLSMHYGPAGKLWLGMDYGVSALSLESRFTTFYDYRGDFGAGHAALLKDGTFYLGTNQGLYRSPWQALDNNREFFDFQLVPGAEGQVWTLENIAGNLFMGHDRGLFKVQAGNVEKVGSPEGVWTILPFKNHLLAGNYNGISIFEKSGSSWVFLKKMDLIAGSCNQLILEGDNILWINIPNFGVIRAELDAQLFPRDRLIFPQDTFQGNDPFLLKDEAGVHVVTDRYTYTFRVADRNFIKKETSLKMPTEIEGLLSGTFKPRPLHDDYDFCPSNSGFLLRHRMPADTPGKANFWVVFRQIEAFNTDQSVTVHPGMEVPSGLNNLKIDFIVPNRDDVLYQFRLDDSDSWSAWTADNSAKFIDLAGGDYTIQVRAKIGDTVTDAQAISIQVAAPWHRSWPALCAYLLMAVMLVFAAQFWKKHSLEKQKRHLVLQEKNALQQQAEAHRQEILLLEQERLQTQYDSLKKNLRSKTIELAKQARENEEKNRLLLSLKEKCATAQENPSLFKIKWKEMERLLESYIKADDQIFEMQLDELHQEFFKKLKTRFPGLSEHDLRLCAYLKIGVDSKEIAEILHIQPSSFYISRSRLRKKLELKADETLYDFLNNI